MQRIVIAANNEFYQYVYGEGAVKSPGRPLRIWFGRASMFSRSAGAEQASTVECPIANYTPRGSFVNVVI